MGNEQAFREINRILKLKQDLNNDEYLEEFSFEEFLLHFIVSKGLGPELRDTIRDFVKNESDDVPDEYYIRFWDKRFAKVV